MDKLQEKFKAGVAKAPQKKSEHPIPLAPVALEGHQVAPEIIAAHTAWIKGSKEIDGLMLMTMKPEIQRNLENLHAHEMLVELKTLYAQQAEQVFLQTMRVFYFCKQEEGQSVSSYVLKMKEFNGFVQNYNMHSLRKTINEFHAMLKLHEQTLLKNNAPALHAIRAGKVQKVNKHEKPQPKMAARGQNQGKEKNKLAYEPKPKIPPPPKREDLAKDSIFHECGDTKQELMVYCYTDTGYLTDADDLKSQTGYVFVLNGGAVDRKSAMPSIFATSSVDAKYIAAFDASKEAAW
nr:hypothetical protein [Tanacetum cinerariifolium]